ELHALTAALEDSRRAPLAIVVEGASGIGKTSLVRQFLADVTAAPDVLVLAGSCSPLESVPFKAVDGVVDALGSFLASLSPQRARQMLPADAPLLASMFPVLRRIPGLAEVPSSMLHGHEQRARAFT